MKTMMEKMMSGMMKPEDMPKMMEGMMDNVFGKMSAKDRIAFVETTLPKCISMLFSELEPEQRKSLAEAMLQRMADELKAQRSVSNASTNARVMYPAALENHPQ